MSINYYMKPKVIEIIKKDIEDKILNSKINIEHDILNQVLSYIEGDDCLLHIGKSSSGWKPTFHKNNYWSSVEEIIDFYEKNKEKVSIVDEYDKELSIEELEDNLINWNKDNKEALTPFNKEKSGFNDYWLKDYYLDKDGYVFTESNFS